MKKLVLILLISAYFTSYSQKNCEDFKIGTFQNIENGVIKAKIERNDSIQIEKHGDKEIKLKIEWVDPCNYRLVFLEGNSAFWANRPKDMPTLDLIVRIIETNEKSYLQEARFENEEGFNYESRITKIE